MNLKNELSLIMETGGNIVLSFSEIKHGNKRPVYPTRSALFIA